MSEEKRDPWLDEPGTQRAGMNLALDAANSLYTLLNSARESSDPDIIRASEHFEALNAAATRFGYHVEIAAAKIPEPEEEEKEDDN